MKPIKRVVFIPNEKHTILDYPNPRIVIANTVLLAEQAFVFTPQELNEYTQSVIKQALEAAVENADLIETDGDVDPKSITSTAEETFKKFEV